MKSKYLFITPALGLSLTIALLWVLGTQNTSAVAAKYALVPDTPADELHVCPSGPPDCPYTSIQDAVDAATGFFPTIKVAAGTYTGVHVRPRDDITTTGVVTQVVYFNKPLTLEGGYTTTNWTTPDPVVNPTILDAQGQGRVIYITHDNHGVIQGLHITGGNDAGLGGSHFEGEDAGGGVYGYNVEFTLKDNVIFGNTSKGRGGGLCFNLNSDSLLEDNLVSDNIAARGGGMYLFGDQAPTLIKNTFYSNTATVHGGGLYLFQNLASLSGNTIAANIVADGNGGGLFLGFSDATLSDNTIISNTALSGGGLNLIWSNPKLVNNVISNNQADMHGGGLQMQGASPRLLHTTITHNSGGDGSAIYIDSPPDSASYTIAMTNTILVSHTVGISVTGGNTVTVNSVLWYNTPVTVSQSTTATVTVQNQYTADPAFTADGYHLMSGSAAVDMGINAGITEDIDGEPRPTGAGYDLGADELCYSIYLPLVLRNP
jgi:parallel beta-helix repeat protein